MQKDPFDKMFSMMEEVARARRLAWHFHHDPIAGRLTRYADELMAEAMGIKAKLLRRAGREQDAGTPAARLASAAPHKRRCAGVKPDRRREPAQKGADLAAGPSFNDSPGSGLQAPSPPKL